MAGLEQQQPTQEEVEADFRNSLKDMIIVAKEVGPYVQSVDELVEMLQLSLTNDGQLRLLMGKVIPKPKR